MVGSERAAARAAATEVTRAGFAPIVRVDRERREIELCATSEALDTYGTIFAYEASREAFSRWAGNVREMHERKAVGRRVAVRCDDDARMVYVRLRISTGAEDTWQKVLDGTLRGASIGASNVEWARERRDGREVPVARRYDLVELSLVDLPSNPDALGVTFVRDGVPLAELLDDVSDEMALTPGPSPTAAGTLTPGPSPTAVGEGMRGATVGEGNQTRGAGPSVMGDALRTAGEEGGSPDGLRHPSPAHGRGAGGEGRLPSPGGSAAVPLPSSTPGRAASDLPSPVRGRGAGGEGRPAPPAVREGSGTLAADDPAAAIAASALVRGRAALATPDAPQDAPSAKRRRLAALGAPRYATTLWGEQVADADDPAGADDGMAAQHAEDGDAAPRADGHAPDRYTHDAHAHPHSGAPLDAADGHHHGGPHLHLDGTSHDHEHVHDHQHGDHLVYGPLATPHSHDHVHAHDHGHAYRLAGGAMLDERLVPAAARARGPFSDNPDGPPDAGVPARAAERPTAAAYGQTPDGNRAAVLHTAARGILAGCGCPACAAALAALDAAADAEDGADDGTGPDARMAEAAVTRALRAHADRLDAAVRAVHAGVGRVAGTLDAIERRVAAIEAQPLPGGPQLRVADKTHALQPHGGRPGLGEQLRALEALAGRLSDPQAQVAVATEMIRLQQEAAGMPPALQAMPRAGHGAH